MPQGDLIGRYLQTVDLLGRISPARDGDTYGGPRATQALVRKAAEPCDALASMHRRGEAELDGDTPARALRVPDGARRTARATLPTDGVG
ncbi:hypothetical protein [Streptomyces sp. NPDC001135]